jgi:hypothetical protein
VNLWNAGAGEISFSCVFVLDLDQGSDDDDDESSDDRSGGRLHGNRR